MELTFKDTLMFYQTSLRNVGLYTSISLALLGVSRFYRGQGDSVYNIAFILVSLATLLLAFSILQNLNSQISMFRGV
jgi:TM2 domain-containing membrane protein YozV